MIEKLESSKFGLHFCIGYFEISRPDPTNVINDSKNLGVSIFSFIKTRRKCMSQKVKFKTRTNIILGIQFMLECDLEINHS